MDAQEFYHAIKPQLDRLSSYAIPLRIRVENQGGGLDSIADVKDIGLCTLPESNGRSDYGLQITLRKEEESE